MRNFIKSKGLLFSVLAIACVGILVTCLLMNREQKSDFQPETISANADSPEVSATPSPAANVGNSANTSTPAPAATKDPMEDYPKVVDESEDNDVIDITPEGEDLETETPEPTAPPAQNNSPATDSSNGNGAVYDPVFGWVVPGQVEQTTADSSGDPNKMVGDM